MGFKQLVADLGLIFTAAYEFNDTVIFGRDSAKLNNSVAAVLTTSLAASTMNMYLMLP